MDLDANSGTFRTAAARVITLAVAMIVVGVDEQEKKRRSGLVGFTLKFLADRLSNRVAKHAHALLVRRYALLIFGLPNKRTQQN